MPVDFFGSSGQTFAPWIQQRLEKWLISARSHLVATREMTPGQRIEQEAQVQMSDPLLFVFNDYQDLPTDMCWMCHA